MTVYLDPVGDAPLPEGVVVLTSEAEFFQKAFLPGPLLVRGPRLVKWAETFYQGRARKLQSLTSPTRQLLALFPTLVPERARQLAATYPLATSAADPTTAAEAVMGGPPWPALMTTAHAMRWLLWHFGEQSAEAKELVGLAGSLLAEQTGQPHYTVDEVLAPDVLDRELGLTSQPASSSPFPLPLTPEVREHLRLRWQPEITQRGAAVFREQHARGADLQALRIVAELTAVWLHHHLEHLDAALLQLLRPHLTPSSAAGLAKRLPPARPTPAPETIGAWAEWMARSYLPYRRQAEPGDLSLQPILRGFAEQFLPTYAGALTASPAAPYLVWNRVAELKHSGAVTLVVICDGLNLDDYATLRDVLAREDHAQRLTLVDDQVAFGALPTITNQAKPALCKGVAPRHIANQPDLGLSTRNLDEVRRALEQAAPGSVVFWNNLQPDKTYHDALSRQQVGADVRATLAATAEHLLSLIDAVPSGVPMQYVITSDHGRMLTVSPRTVTPPEGFQPEQRTATGTSPRMVPEGYVFTDGYVFLSRHRFGLGQDVAVMWADQTFTKANGHGGQEICPHGGISPEEVLIPWAVFRRDLHLSLPEIRGEGSGVADEPGAFTLHVVNANPIGVTLEHVETNFAFDEGAVREVRIPANSSVHLSMPVLSWPGVQAAAAATLRVTLRFSGQAARTVDVPLTLTSEELYTRNGNILADLW